MISAHALAARSSSRAVCPRVTPNLRRVSTTRHLSTVRDSRVPRRAVAPRASRDDDESFLPNSLGTVGAAIELRSRLQDLELERQSARGGRGGDGWEKVADAWVRLPPGRAWGVVHFIGGAVLGSYPHIAYDAFLTRVCEDAGVVVVATPYELGVDHAAVASSCGASFDAAWASVAAREGYDPTVAPVFAAGHSLGCKLQLITSCGGTSNPGRGGEGSSADVDAAGPRRAGHLFVSFNNATAADSVRLLEKFARELIKRRVETASGGDASANAAFENFARNLPNLTALAERAASAAGLDFTPSPEETVDGARRRFVSPKVKLVTFEDDDLDQNEELEAALRKRYETVVAGEAPVERATLPGNHLTPVFFQFDGAKLSPAFGKLGGLRVGDEEAVAKLAEEGVKFLTGKK
jgi:hypothetical protein